MTRADVLALAFNTFNKLLSGGFKSIVFAYSGGKDSTLTLILFREWLQAGGGEKLGDKPVLILHNDTLGEIPAVEEWARGFGARFAEELRKMGVRAEFRLTAPPPRDTFYWRVVVRGYAAPTFKFRWCTHLLKMQPTRRELESCVASHGSPAALVTGARREESVLRSMSISKYIMDSEIPGVAKLYPIAEWREGDVWAYLAEKYLGGHRELGALFRLYGLNPDWGLLSSAGPVRYGCWFCTVAERHRGLLAASRLLDERYEYLECGRILLRCISDMPELRERKGRGYSRLGPLNAAGRGLALKLFKAVEELSGTRLYGLDEAKLQFDGEAFTLREVFYDLDADYVARILEKLEDQRRPSNFEEIRNPRIDASLAEKLKSCAVEKSRKVSPEVAGKVAEVADALFS